MENQVEIAFEDLLKMVKQLPADQLARLKTEIEKLQEKPKMSSEEFMAFLQTGPVATQEEIQAIENARKDINSWGTK